MIYLKDILLEAKVAHTQKSLQWVYHGYIAMTPKVIKQIMGDVPITTFHNLNPEAVKKQLPKVIGKKKSISTFTADTEGNLAMGSGVQTSGGVVLEVEGKVLVAGTEDLGSVPDEAGRRWISTDVLGKIIGITQFKGEGGSQKFKKELYKIDKKLEDMLWKYKTSLLVLPEDPPDVKKRFPLYTGKQKAELIKRWIDASNKFLLKNKKKIKKSFEDNINNPKITKFMSSYGYNELLVYDVKVKDAYIVIDAVGDPNDFKATDKALNDIKKDLKPFVKGKIFTGFVDGVKKFLKKRGGKV
jgi:hypothetical protein